MIAIMLSIDANRVKTYKHEAPSGNQAQHICVSSALFSQHCPCAPYRVAFAEPSLFSINNVTYYPHRNLIGTLFLIATPILADFHNLSAEVSLRDRGVNYPYTGAILVASKNYNYDTFRHSRYFRCQQSTSIHEVHFSCLWI